MNHYQIDEDFVYNRFPKTTHDEELLKIYKAMIASAGDLGEDKDSLSLRFTLLPIYENTKGNDIGMPVLTRSSSIMRLMASGMWISQVGPLTITI